MVVIIWRKNVTTLLTGHDFSRNGKPMECCYRDENTDEDKLGVVQSYNITHPLPFPSLPADQHRPYCHCWLKYS